jgi:hypothetical protein
LAWILAVDASRTPIVVRHLGKVDLSVEALLEAPINQSR